MPSFPESLRPENLMEHMRALCIDIGPRPSTSPKEREAANYVKKTLAALGITQVQEYPFKSQPSLGWVSIPFIVAVALAVPLAWIVGGVAGKLIAGLLWLAGAYSLRQFFLARPPFYQKLIARGDSQNVAAVVSPKGDIRRRLFLIGHLDSQKQRFMAPSPRQRIDKLYNTLNIALLAFFGLSMLFDVVQGYTQVSILQWFGGAMAALGVVQLLNDERQPHIQGANDNATAVSILLGMAEALKADPPEHTEVTLLFTGCEEVVCVGMESYLEQCAPPKENTYWIDLEMVGTANLCYATKHGMSYFSEYTPSQGMVEIARRTAEANPDLRITGKEMLILEEVSNLAVRGYERICVAGYNEQGFLPNWHRLSDNIDHIEPETLGRAARYTWAMTKEIDRLN